MTLPCPICGRTNSRVRITTQATLENGQKATQRIRRCSFEDCDAQFTTYEVQHGAIIEHYSQTQEAKAAEKQSGILTRNLLKPPHDGATYCPHCKSPNLSAPRTSQWLPNEYARLRKCIACDKAVYTYVDLTTETVRVSKVGWYSQARAVRRGELPTE